MLGFSYLVGLINTITANQVLEWVQILAGIAATAYYLNRITRNDR